MCGIFGIIANKGSGLTQEATSKLIDDLFTLSESRGKESSGMTIRSNATKEINVLKHSVPATELIKSQEFKSYLKNSIQSSFDEKGLSSPLVIVAHARLVTNGSQENNNNNQPIIKSGMVTVHNGIITNVDRLWSEHKELNRAFEVDTEVMLALIKDNAEKGMGLIPSIQKAVKELKGTLSTCILFDDRDQVILGTNNGSLYFSYNEKLNLFVFASEKFILDKALNDQNFYETYSLPKPTWSKPDIGIQVTLNPFSMEKFGLKDRSEALPEKTLENKFKIINHSPDKPVDFQEVNRYFHVNKVSPLRKLLEFNSEAIKKMKRCSKCLLPESFPFIVYDAKGVCNYCHKYVLKSQGNREAEFIELMKQYRTKDGSPDCIIPFSGGRDSSYGLHYIVRELKLKPVTYTYDWGMVTDLARRNIARVCGKLGVENILVSADLKMKRRNIKLNVEAWLRRPVLGLIPLFMAGDKQFFHYVNEVKKQTGISMDIWSTNQLENTDFKVGFCGVSPSFDKTRPDYLSLGSKMKMMGFYAKEFLLNPAFINASIKDTLESFYAYYQAPRTDFYQLFDWIKWDEKEIESTLFNEYDWELAPDTKSTWRIGDGTAPFYNYIYYTVTGFSEFDTFRSNQIREGLITREQGLEFIYEENKPRFESLKWYLDAIDVDFERAVKVVNNMPKMYQKYL